MVKSKLVVFDTTLRDGEQSPGVTLTITEKLEIAKQLSRLGVDVCEAVSLILMVRGFRLLLWGILRQLRELQRKSGRSFTGGKNQW